MIMIKKFIKLSKRICIISSLIMAILTINSSCQQLPRKILSVTKPNVYAPSFNFYNGKCKTFNFKAFTINLPENTIITSNTFDGVKYKINAEGNQFYDISAIPFEREPSEANNLKDVNIATLNFSDPIFPFTEGNIKGLYAEGYDEKKIFSYERFCFTKQGFTFYISSYGDSETYHSILDFIKSIKILANPIKGNEMKKLADQMLESYQKEALQLINKDFHKEDNMGMKLLDDFKCTKVKGSFVKNALYLKCILIGDYSQLYPAQKSSLEDISRKVSSILPYSDNFELLGYKIIINYYKPSGEQISLERDMFE